MFLGPVEQSKPWNTHGIEGVSKFLRKFWSLFFDAKGNFNVSDGKPTKVELKILHTAIKKIAHDIERFSFNTCVSNFMVLTNDLKKAKCNKRVILQEAVALIAPFAPHIAEELWHRLGNEGTVNDATYPIHNEAFLKEDEISYPLCVNGKKRAVMNFSADASKADMEKAAVEHPTIQRWAEGKTIRKVIVVPKRMINVVIK